MKGLLLKIAGEILFLVLLTLCIFMYANAAETTMLKGHATVYSLNGRTAMGTPVRWGVAASGNRELLGKLVIVYQRLPDDSVGDVIGIYSVEDTGCKYGVIDIWCPTECRQAVINKTWENGCRGRIYIQEVQNDKK